MTGQNHVTQLAKVISPFETELERRASAIADVQQMHADLRKALEIANSLKAENALLSAKLEDVTRDRDRERRDGRMWRDQCLELATCVANIGLLTVKAQEVVATVREITERDEPANAGR